MKGAIGLLIAIVSIVFVLLFLVGVAGNWTPVAGDIFGLMTFFTAVAETINEFVVVTNLVVWTFVFFAVQGLFLFVYYKIGRFIYVRMPEIQSWYEKTRMWVSR